MDYGQALEVISGLENGADIVDAVKGKVQTVNQEAHTLRTKLKSFEGVDVDNYQTLTSALAEADLDFSGNIADQITALKGNAAKATQKDSELQTLTKQLKALTQTVEQTQAEAKRLKAESARGQAKSAFQKSFESRVLNPDITLEFLLDRGNITLGEDGSAGYKGKDGMFYSTDNGAIDQLLKDFPDSAKSVQKPGSGSGTPSTSEAKNTITRSQFNDMSPADQSSHFKDGGTVVD